MGFVISELKSYKWPVTIEVPVDGGLHEKHTFEAEFKRVTQERAEEITKSMFEGDTNDREIVKEVMTGWNDILAPGGEQLPFSPTALDQLLSIPTVGMTIIKAWLESISGAKRKN